MSELVKLKKQLKKEGLESLGLYYGIYEGLVAENLDPKSRLRIKIYCPYLYGENIPDKWALPRGIFLGKNIGMPMLPQKNDPIWITCRNGDPDYPLWEYGWFPENFAPELTSPNKYFLQTPKGYRLLFDEENELHELYFSDNIKLTINKDKFSFIYGEKTLIEFSDKILINAGDENMLSLISELIDSLVSAIVQTPNGPGFFNPGTKQKLNSVKNKFSNLLQ